MFILSKFFFSVEVEVVWQNSRCQQQQSKLYEIWNKKEMTRFFSCWFCDQFLTQIWIAPRDSNFIFRISNATIITTNQIFYAFFPHFSIWTADLLIIRLRSMCERRETSEIASGTVNQMPIFPCKRCWLSVDAGKLIQYRLVRPPAKNDKTSEIFLLNRAIFFILARANKP